MQWFQAIVREDRLSSRGFGLTDVGSLANHVLAVRTDPDGSHPWWGEHANVRVGDKPLAITTVIHEGQSFHVPTCI